MVSELPGRNVSEPEGSFEIAEPWRLSPSLSDESSTEDGNLTDTVFRSGGVVGAARQQGRRGNWRSRPDPGREIGGSKVARITGTTGKAGEGQTVTAGV